jgi:hypothetical protein
LDLETSEPLILLGLKGKIVWVVFWSANSTSGKASLPMLEAAWKRLKQNRRFSLIAAAVDSEAAQQVRSTITAAKATMPVYLASLETRRRFGALDADPPLHLLIDEQGRIATLARGASRQTIDRLATQAQSRLNELDPLRNTRFAGTLLRSSVPGLDHRRGSSPIPCYLEDTTVVFGPEQVLALTGLVQGTLLDRGTLGNSGRP